MTRSERPSIFDDIVFVTELLRGFFRISIIFYRFLFTEVPFWTTSLCSEWMFCCIHFTFSAFILLSRLIRNVNGQWYFVEFFRPIAPKVVVKVVDRGVDCILYKLFE